MKQIKGNLGFYTIKVQSTQDIRYCRIIALNACDWQFYPATENLEPFPNLETRMKWYNKTAPALSVAAIEKCIDNKLLKNEITHLITVSCTGISAPGLDLHDYGRNGFTRQYFSHISKFYGMLCGDTRLKTGRCFLQ